MDIFKKFNYEFKDPENFFLDPIALAIDKIAGSWNTGPTTIVGDTERATNSQILMVYFKSPAVVVSYKDYDGEEKVFIENGIPVFKRKMKEQVLTNGLRKPEVPDTKVTVVGPDSIVLGLLIADDEFNLSKYSKNNFDNQSILLKCLQTTFNELSISGTWGVTNKKDLIYVTVDNNIVGSIIVDSIDGCSELMFINFKLSKDISNLYDCGTDLSNWVSEDKKELFFNKLTSIVEIKVVEYAHYLEGINHNFVGDSIKPKGKSENSKLYRMGLSNPFSFTGFSGLKSEIAKKELVEVNSSYNTVKAKFDAKRKQISDLNKSTLDTSNKKVENLREIQENNFLEAENLQKEMNDIISRKKSLENILNKADR